MTHLEDIYIYIVEHFLGRSQTYLDLSPLTQNSTSFLISKIPHGRQKCLLNFGSSYMCVCAYVMFTLLFKSHKHTYMYEWQFTLILPSTIKCLPHKAYITQCINLRILIVDCVLQVFKWLDEFILCFISCRTVAAWENIGVDQQATYSA